MQQKKISIKWIFGLLLVFLIYSSANIFMKLSSSEDGMLMLIYLSCAIGILGIYACLWQQVLKHISLTTAFMFKSVTVIYGILFAHVLFLEEITVNNIIGAAMIVAGIVVLGWRS